MQSKQALTVSLVNKSDVLQVVELKGLLNGDTIKILEDFLSQLNGSHKVILSMKKLTYISSAGVGLIMSNIKHYENLGGKLILAEPTDSVNEVFNILGLNKIFKIYNNLDDVLKQFS